MKRSVFLLLITLLVSCSSEQLTPEAYMQWIRSDENGLHVSKQFDGVDFDLQYEPATYQVLKRSDATSVNLKEVQAESVGLATMNLFTFSITCPNGEDPARYTCSDEADYQQWLNYLLADMQQDFELITGSDTIPCAYYHYERNYHTSPKHNFQIGFPVVKGDSSSKLQVKFNDQLFGIGPVQFSISADALSHIPSLKL
jgi:hypothetical protein